MQRPPPSIVAVASVVTSGTQRARALHGVADRAARLAETAGGARTGAELAPHVSALAALLEEAARVQATHDQLGPSLRPVGWWARVRMAWAVLWGA
jgi:hypothetical protein